MVGPRGLSDIAVIVGLVIVLAILMADLMSVIVGLIVLICGQSSGLVCYL